MTALKHASLVGQAEGRNAPKAPSDNPAGEVERLRAALQACLTAMVDYGDGTCGIHCEAMIDTPTPFPEEIALARAALEASQ